MIFTGVVCRLQICRCTKAQWFDSTFRAIIILFVMFVFYLVNLFYYFVFIYLLLGIVVVVVGCV